MKDLVINALLEEYSVAVNFSEPAVKDLAGYDQSTREYIIALIIKRARSGPLIRPKGVGKPLGKKLAGFTAIKSGQLNIRIVYRPVELSDRIVMQVIAIGPRDKEAVYRKAVHRLYEFANEMDKRK
jgi:mRNA interferase RelE/StbE